MIEPRRVVYDREVSNLLIGALGGLLWGVACMAAFVLLAFPVWVPVVAGSLGVAVCGTCWRNPQTRRGGVAFLLVSTVVFLCLFVILLLWALSGFSS